MIFLTMLEAVLNENVNIQIAFMGKFDTYDEKIERFTKVKNSSINLGKQMDALAVIECCDLYVNPKEVVEEVLLLKHYIREFQ